MKTALVIPMPCELAELVRLLTALNEVYPRSYARPAVYQGVPKVFVTEKGSLRLEVAE